MIEIKCACAQSPTLWTTVENPVDKPVSKSAHAMLLSLKTNKELTSSIQEALLDALDLFNARLDALEHDISNILGILHSPLAPAEAIERLRRLREML